MGIWQSSGLSGFAAVFIASSLAWGDRAEYERDHQTFHSSEPAELDRCSEMVIQRTGCAAKEEWRNCSQTYQVFVIEGSQYNKLIALNDHPLSPEQSAKEEQKLKDEIRKRKNEAPAERNKRVQDYRRERNQDHAMMLEMMNAFVFTPAGEESVRGRATYVLDATPKPGYTPKNRDTKVLTGMKGRLYVDKATFQWVKVQAEVTNPVSFYGFLAKVEPGTRFFLEQAPVSSRLWFPIHFRQEVNATALGVIHRDKKRTKRTATIV